MVLWRSPGRLGRLLPELEEIDFTNKLVAIFGCGDQEDYAEYFLDAMGTLRDIVEAKGAIVIGNWPTAGYEFEASRHWWTTSTSSVWASTKIASRS